MFETRWGNLALDRRNRATENDTSRKKHPHLQRRSRAETSASHRPDNTFLWRGKSTRAISPSRSSLEASLLSVRSYAPGCRVEGSGYYRIVTRCKGLGYQHVVSKCKGLGYQRIVSRCKNLGHQRIVSRCKASGYQRIFSRCKGLWHQHIVSKCKG